MKIDIYDSDYERLSRLSEIMQVDKDIIINEIFDNWFDEYRKMAGVTEEQMEGVTEY
jgi:hypothetical protein